MPTSPDHERTVMSRQALLPLAALCVLLAGGNSFYAAVALAAALPPVIVAGHVLARLVAHRLPAAAGTAVTVIGMAAVAASLMYAMNALWPSLGDAPGLFLPLGVTSALLAADAGGTLSPVRALGASLAQAAILGLVLVGVAAARELAGWLTPLALAPPGVFIVLGCGLALYNHLVRGRSPPAPSVEPGA